jgi:hypothetical protein
VTGIEPALSAWELACHADGNQGIAGQPPSPVVREYPLITVSDLSNGHATGTATLSRSHLIRRDLRASPPPAYTSVDLPKCDSVLRIYSRRYAAPCGQNPASVVRWSSRSAGPMTVKPILTVNLSLALLPRAAFRPGQDGRSAASTAWQVCSTVSRSQSITEYGCLSAEN